MTPSETAEVLGKAALFDFRTVGESDVMAWWEVVGDLDYLDSMMAVSRWYRDRSDRLMPAHLREAVGLIQAERAVRNRLAAAEARAESVLCPPQEAVGRRYAELPPEMQATLSAASRGLLRAVTAERFRDARGREYIGATWAQDSTEDSDDPPVRREYHLDP